MKTFTNSDLVSFGNFLLEKHGVAAPVTSEDVQAFYDRPAAAPVTEASDAEATIADNLLEPAAATQNDSEDLPL